MKLLVPVRRENRIVLGVAFFIVFVALWSFLSLSGAVPKHFLATPWQTVASGWNLFATQGFTYDVGMTIWRVVGGFVLAAVIAVPLGIAMGSGSGATRAVAQLVLLDNRWSVMPSVVAEGRRVLGNIERVSDVFLTKSFYAMIISIVVGITAITFPFLPRHLSLIGALTIGIPGFFLALMPNTERFRPGFFRRVLLFAAPALLQDPAPR